MARGWQNGFQQWLSRGFATLQAEFRRGLKDLQNAVLNPWNGFSATHEEAGTIANPTQQLVTQAMQGDRGGKVMYGPEMKSRDIKPEKQPDVQPEQQPDTEQKADGGRLKAMLNDALARCADRSEDRSAEHDLEMER